MTVFTVTAEETARFHQSDSNLSGYAEAIHEGLHLHPSYATLLRRITTIIDKVALKQRMSVAGVYHLPLHDRLVITALYGYQSTARIAERLGISAHLTAARASILREHLTIALGMSQDWYYKATLQERAAFHDQVRRGLGATIHATLALHASLTPLHKLMAQVVSSLHLTAAVSPQLMIVVIEREGIEFNDHDVVKMIFDGQLREGLDFFLDFVEPSGSVTTWATNVRTGAVTEYLNYAFNSFAFGPNSTYVGAADDGLYELVGDTDGTDAIVTDMITGLMELNGSHFTSFQAAYLAVRGNGRFYLKLLSGDGKVYVYAADTKNLRTTRIDIGKGVRARYFTFELISTGQDFDLTSVEFLPIGSTRRV